MMKTAIIILVILIYLILGCFLMMKVNDFIESNRRESSEKPERKDPSCVILVGEQTEENIIYSLRDFRKSHSNTRILIYDSTGDIPENSRAEDIYDSRI